LCYESINRNTFSLPEVSRAYSAFGAAMLPVWAAAARKIKAGLRSRLIPRMALGAAFSFTIMMYNIPVPGGSTAHAVGGAMLAIILGPWAASVCLTIALAIQALLFGDGGIWSFGANCFAMAFVLPFVAWGVYRLVAGWGVSSSARQWSGAALGGYLGLNAAALVIATALGLQPLLFHSADGTPLYCPFPLNLAVPAMMLGHLILAGPLEALVTALVVRGLQAGDAQLRGGNIRFATPAAHTRPPGGPLWRGLGVLILLSPMGLLARGSAWGEWGAEELKEMLGFVPAGFRQLAAAWPQAPLQDYSLPGAVGGAGSGGFGYLLCALIGVGAVAGLMFLLGRLQAAERSSPPVDGEGRWR
jgi:cobalt/nickel transport system permease protein